MLLKCWRTIAASVCHGDTGARSMSFDSDVSCSNSAISCCSQWAEYVLLDAVRLTPAAAAVNAAGMRGGEKQSDGLSWAAYWGFHVGGHLVRKFDLMINVTAWTVKWKYTVAKVNRLCRTFVFSAVCLANWCSKLVSVGSGQKWIFYFWVGF